MKTLHVTKTSLNELKKHGWEVSMMRESFPYIRCDKSGKVNWDKTPILYRPEELIERNNVKIIKRA